uniref:UBC core domain-containing protein n=1 Tax=Neogobius melanostomus TaxID=47308 RepID=A0A8C6SC17_9GOBI
LFFKSFHQKLTSVSEDALKQFKAYIGAFDELSVNIDISHTAFWKLLMEGPPDTPYESGVFELFCQFGPDYPVKPPTVHISLQYKQCGSYLPQLI